MRLTIQYKNYSRTRTLWIVYFNSNLYERPCMTETITKESIFLNVSLSLIKWCKRFFLLKTPISFFSFTSFLGTLSWRKIRFLIYQYQQLKYYESFELKILIGVEKIIIRGKVGFGFLPEKRFFVTNSSTQADKKYLFQHHTFKFNVILSRRNIHSFFLEQKSAKWKLLYFLEYLII